MGWGEFHIAIVELTMLGAGWGLIGYVISRPGGGFRAAARLCLYLVVLLAAVSGAECAGRVVIVVANRVVLADIDNPELKNIRRMVREGAVGLVCPDCAGPKSEYSVVMTAGCGAGCVGVTENREFYGSAESLSDGLPAAEVFEAGTGYRVPDGSVVFLGLGPAQRRKLEAGNKSVTLGACGEELNRAGVRGCLIGNADMPERIDRSVGVLAMDSSGIVDSGRISAGAGRGWPETLLSDVREISEAVNECAARAEYLVVSFGDTTRVDEMMPDLSEVAYTQHKADAMRNLDRLIGMLMGSGELRGVKIVLVSFSPSLQDTWRQPTPIVMWPTDGAGLMVSATTRTPGFVAASDFAPTVLRLLDVPISEGMVGRAMYETGRVTGEARWKFLREAESRVAANTVLYMPVLLVVVFLGAILFSVVAGLAAFSRVVTPRIDGFLRYGMLVSASWPLAMLLAVFAPVGIVWYLGATVVGALVTALIALIVGRGFRMSAVMVVYALTVAGLFADVLTGCRLCSFALPGSSQITAMRFYGIGNEYAGILIAMAACLALFASRGTRKWVVPALGESVVVLFAVGGWGANYGAAISATVTFGLMWIGVRRGRFGARHVVMAVMAGFALVFALAYTDLKVSGITASHAGRTTGLMQSLGVTYLLSLVSRKILLNLAHMGMEHTKWVVMSFVPFLGLWFWGVQAKVMSRLKGDLGAIAGLKAALIGAVVAFLFNDSGIVMSSIIVSMIVLVLLYSLLGKQEDANCRGQ